MRGYGQFCPVAKAAEIFAERWTPLIMREILLGSHRFSDLERGLPRISKALLSQRLKTLDDAGLIERRIDADRRTAAYFPTQAGQELFGVIESLGEWGARWVTHSIEDEDIDPDLLVWDMHRRLNLERLPEHRTVVRLDFTGLSVASYWLVLSRDDASVCLTHPGFDEDLLVTTDTVAMHKVWMGHVSLSHALRSGQVQIEGPAELRRAFPEWLKLSMFAHVAPMQAAAAD